MIKLLASDLDGTIVSNNQITTDDLEAVERLKQTDVKFVICTGKTYVMTKDICHQLEPAYGIFGNGTQIMNIQTGKEIIRNTITNTQIMDCLKIAKKHHLHIHIYTDHKIIAQEKLDYMAYRNYILYKDQVEIEIVDSIENYIKEKNPNILKLILSGEKELSKVKNEIESKEKVTAIRIKKCGQYIDKVVGKEYEYLDIVPKHITKYQALMQLSIYLGIPMEQIMAIGDNINDIEMIKHAGIGVAIGGSYKRVQNVATYVTKNTVKTGGFAEAVDKFLIETRSENVYSRRI